MALDSGPNLASSRVDYERGDAGLKSRQVSATVCARGWLSKAWNHRDWQTDCEINNHPPSTWVMQRVTVAHCAYFQVFCTVLVLFLWLYSLVSQRHKHNVSIKVTVWLEMMFWTKSLLSVLFGQKTYFFFFWEGGGDQPSPCSPVK